MSQEREFLGSRLGFLLLSAGCAIGLGNVWRFPFITGQYGGAAFVLVYLVFLVILGLPIMVMEFAVGRGAGRGAGQAFRILQPKGTCWHLHGYIAVAGCYVLLMFYTTVTGWMLAYTWYALSGQLAGLNPEQVGQFFGNMLADPKAQVGWMCATVAFSAAVCSTGLRAGVERMTKVMMICLLLVMLLLVFRAVSLPGAMEGIRFYLMPDFGKMVEHGIGNVVFAAMGQAFFTLSLGIGCMAIFGSYIQKGRSLTGESVYILILDTFVALMAGLIIFPTCFAFGVNPDAGPGLIFVTLPNVFNSMPGGTLWGALFFVFMSFAALTTVVAVLENLVAHSIDMIGMTRQKASLLNGLLLAVLSLPCALGFNVLSDIQPFGAGSGILDLEDFIVSNNLLPLGAMVFLFFCCSNKGWGWKNFIAEADAGKGLRFPQIVLPYLHYVLPLIVLYVFVQGYVIKFWK